MKIVNQIKDTASNIHAKITKKKKPEVSIPLRSLSNVNYDPKKGYFELKGAKKIRTLTVNTIKSFAQTLKMIDSDPKPYTSHVRVAVRELFTNIRRNVL